MRYFWSLFIPYSVRERGSLSGRFLFEPADIAKFTLIALLAKYFSRRHVEIGNFRHIIVSGAYMFLFAILVLAEPDMGNAIIFGTIWLGMILVSGISKKHLIILGIVGLGIALVFWFAGLKAISTCAHCFIYKSSSGHSWLWL